MNEETKNDIYDLLDLLNKLYSLQFLSDKDRLNDVRNEIMATMSGRISKGFTEEKSEANSLYSMDNIINLLQEMKKIRRKDKLIDFLVEIDIKPYDKKLSLGDMRARAIVELIERGIKNNEEEDINIKKKPKVKKTEKDKKDFMDMWLDFYKQNKNIE